MLARATDSKWGRSPVSPTRLRAHWEGWHTWVGWHTWAGWHAWAEGTRVGRGDTRGQGGTVSAATRRQQVAAAGVIGDTPVSPVPPQGSRPRGAHGGARPPPAPSPLAHPCPPVPPRPDGHTRVLELQKPPPATSLPPREGQERWHRGHEGGCRRMGSTLGILGCWWGAQEGDHRDNPGASRCHCQLPAAVPDVPVPPPMEEAAGNRGAGRFSTSLKPPLCRHGGGTLKGP